MQTNQLTCCPRCHAPWAPTLAYNGAVSEFWKECSNPKCRTYLNTYTPQAHQQAFHKDPHRIKGNFGGYGSGKTLTSRQEVYKHIFLTPSGNTLIGANVSSQYEQTIKRDIEADIPKAFITYESKIKQYYNFFNGHRLLYRPLDDEGKLRSYNLDMFLILEGSEVKPDSFTQLKTRLRSIKAGKQLYKTPEPTKENPNPKSEPVFRTARNGVKIPVFEAVWLEGIIESNPDAGWIRQEVLKPSEKIHKHGQIMDSLDYPDTLKDPLISSHVTSTTANEFLPTDFIEQNSKNKPLWWVNRYLYGSFAHSEGLVYPAAARAVVPEFKIPANWRRVIALDYGLSDPTAIIFVAIDEENSMAYAYKEVRVVDKNTSEIAAAFHKGASDIPTGGLYCTPLIDPMSAPKRDFQKKTLADYLLDEGLIFQPGVKSVDARVFRLNTYLESGRLKIFNTLKYLNDELSEYRFLPDPEASSGFKAKPVDKNNHSINALEWIICALPDNPDDLRYAYNKQGKPLLPDKEQNLYYDPFAEPSKPENLPYAVDTSHIF